MLRKAPVKKLPKVVAAVVSEGVATNDIERVHGAAQLLAVSIIGPSYTLHSRAEPVLAALFSMSSLKADSSLHIAGVFGPQGPHASADQRFQASRPPPPKELTSSHNILEQYCFLYPACDAVIGSIVAFSLCSPHKIYPTNMNNSI